PDVLWNVNRLSFVDAPDILCTCTCVTAVFENCAATYSWVTVSVVRIEIKLLHKPKMRFAVASSVFASMSLTVCVARYNSNELLRPILSRFNTASLFSNAACASSTKIDARGAWVSSLLYRRPDTAAISDINSRAMNPAVLESVMESRLM